MGRLTQYAGQIRDEHWGKYLIMAPTKEGSQRIGRLDQVEDGHQG